MTGRDLTAWRERHDMTIEQAVLENLKVLPLGKKQEVLEFTESLTKKENGGSGQHNKLVDSDLSLLDENELTHLEMEFENYEQLYPLQ